MAISIGAAAAIGSLGYGVYAGQQAQKSQAAASSQAQQEFQQQQAQQQQQYQQQLQQEAATNASNLSQQQQTQQQTAAAQQTALADEKAAIPINTSNLQNTLTAANAQAQAAEAPAITDQMQAMGLVDSGALAAQNAKYGNSLNSQMLNAIAQYQTGANSQLQTDTTADTAKQVQADEANALLNMQNSEQNMAQNFATTNVNNTNNTAYEQYITNLQSAQAQSQQQNANSFTNFGGQIGGGLLNYYGNQNNSNPALSALLQNQNNSVGGGTQYAPGSWSYPTQNLPTGSGGSGFAG